MSGTDERLREHFRRAAPDVVADDALLHSLQATADRRRSRRRLASAGLIAVAAAAAIVVGLAVASTDDGLPENVDVVAPAPKAADEADARDWDGARFDFGRIERVHRQGDELLLDFDRTQLVTDGGTRKSGPDFAEEPVVVGNTDEPTVNENRRLRTYVVREDAEALVIDNLRETCSDLEQPAPPRWRRLDRGALVDSRLWSDYTQVSLTFDPEGFVLRVRLAGGC
jgi:hypothetical protein